MKSVRKNMEGLVMINVAHKRFEKARFNQQCVYCWQNTQNTVHLLKLFRSIAVYTYAQVLRTSQAGKEFLGVPFHVYFCGRTSLFLHSRLFCARM
jgi:hypothetical protein